MFVARLLVGRYFCFLLITICWLLATLCWLVLCDEIIKQNEKKKALNSVLVASAKILQCEGRILPPSFYGQLLDY